MVDESAVNSSTFVETSCEELCTLCQRSTPSAIQLYLFLSLVAHYDGGFCNIGFCLLESFAAFIQSMQVGCYTQLELSSNALQVGLEESRQGTLSERLKAIDAANLEKKRELTAANIRKNREGNKGTATGHD